MGIRFGTVLLVSSGCISLVCFFSPPTKVEVTKDEWSRRVFPTSENLCSLLTYLLTAALTEHSFDIVYDLVAVRRLSTFSMSTLRPVLLYIFSVNCTTCIVRETPYLQERKRNNLTYFMFTLIRYTSLLF